MLQPEIERIVNALKYHRFIVANEKAIQMKMEQLFTEKEFLFKREYHFGKKNENIIDFLMEDGTGIEVKLKYRKRAIYNQILRYSAFDEIKRIILVTGTNMGLPAELNGKPTYIFNISRAWL